MSILNLVAKRQSSHPRLYAQHVVVGREHVESIVSDTRLWFDRNLRVVDSGEVAGTRWLVFFWLKREGVRVDTWHWGTGVVVEWLDLVEVLTTLFLESVLAVKNQLEAFEWTRSFFVELSTFLQEHWCTRGGWRGKAVGVEDGLVNVRRQSDVSVREVPQVRVVRPPFIQAPDQFLDWVVVGQSLLVFRTDRDRIRTSVLDLFDQVFVTLLRESSALFSVEVHVVTPHLEGRTIRVGGEFRRQVKVQSDFVVLQSNQWQGQSWVSVKEEDQWQIDGLRGNDTGSHLTVIELGRFGQVQFRVQSPPLLVVLVDSLTTDGQFNILDRTFRDPGIRGDTRRRGSFQFNVHVRDQITISGDRDGDATVRRGRTVNSLFDVFHRKVSVAFVNRLEESDFWVTSQVDVLGAIGDELHETSGHSVCFVLYTKIFFSGETREKTHIDFSWYIEMTDQEETLLEPTEETENSEIVSDDELPVIEDTLELSDDDEDMEMLEDDDEGYMMDMDMGGLLSSVLATEDGDTVCSALVNISRQMEVQNKILIKMLSHMQKN